MVNLTTINSSFELIRNITTLRDQFDDLQRQFATGRKEETFGNLGPDRNISISFRAQLSRIEGYQKAIRDQSVSIDTMASTLERIDALTSNTKNNAFPLGYTLQSGTRTIPQVEAEQALAEVVSLLNLEVGGKFLFSGRATDTRPVAELDDILDGTGGQAGFNQIVNERRTADLGGAITDATLNGRLDITSTLDTVSIAATGGVFGFSFPASAISTTNPGAMTVTDAAGAPPTATVQFTGIPAVGDVVRIQLAMPDGTIQDINLTATTQNPPDEGEFLIDADPNVQATNFQTAFAERVDYFARTQLAAASANRAGEDFFSNDPPLRVVDPGTSLADATALAADPTNTVRWYLGESGLDDPRLTAVAKIDDGISVGYGARANETSLLKTVREIAVFSTFSTAGNDNLDTQRYDAMASRTRSDLDDPSGETLPRSIINDLRLAQASFSVAEQRNDNKQTSLENLIFEIEGITQEEAAAQILTLQTRLQATYSATALINDLSLVNFL
jgi:flagellar hook-associated protein 3 FlgL